jgi:hypothetical protein
MAVPHPVAKEYLGSLHCLLRPTFGLKREEETGNSTKFHIEEFVIFLCTK